MPEINTDTKTYLLLPSPSALPNSRLTKERSTVANPKALCKVFSVRRVFFMYLRRPGLLVAIVTDLWTWITVFYYFFFEIKSIIVLLVCAALFDLICEWLRGNLYFLVNFRYWERNMNIFSYENILMRKNYFRKQVLLLRFLVNNRDVIF